MLVLLFLLWLFYLFAIEGDADGFLFGRDPDAIGGLGGVFVGSGAEKVESVAVALKFEFVFGELDLVDLNLAEGERALRGVAGEVTVLVEFEAVVLVAVAEVERFADEELLELVFFEFAGGGLEGEGTGGEEGILLFR